MDFCFLPPAPCLKLKRGWTESMKLLQAAKGLKTPPQLLQTKLQCVIPAAAHLTHVASVLGYPPWLSPPVPHNKYCCLIHLHKIIVGAYLGLGMPTEMEAVCLTWYQQIKGQSVVIDQVISHIIKFCINT